MPDDSSDTPSLALARRFIDALPLPQALGMRMDSVGPGEAVLSMGWDPRFVGDLARGVIHGGAVSALLDTACGAAVMSDPAQAGATATLDLRIDYMRGATPGQRLVARAACFHRTRSVVFVRASAHDDDAGCPVATATATFTTGG